VETLKLYWLGYPLIELKGKPLKLETRKAAALLSYLSLNPGECPREVLSTMLWQEGSQQKALANLRRTLSSLNSTLPGWIEANRDTIALKRNGKLWVDVEVFHQLLAQLKEHAHSEKEVCEDCLTILDETAALYRGDFMEGLNLVDSPAFDEWQFFQRDGLRRQLAEVLQRLSIAHSKQGQWDQAIVHARRWVALDRLHEPACRVLMDLYACSGQRSAALRQYEELTRSLSEQLGQEPEMETSQLYEQIRGNDGAKQAAEPPKQSTSLPLLKTKLYIPTVPASRVMRSRLIGRLGEAEKHALTIISAPAGFGKTTLLAEWITRTSLPVAWLSLDSGDNDPYRFLSYLVSALEGIHEGVGIEARQIMQSLQLVPSHIILASLMNDLGRLAEPYVLVLDDYQFITEHLVHEAMSYLLDHIPSNMHLVISTRADPPLQLGRLRAHDQMLELRTQDLRFTPEEATEFLNAVMHLDLLTKDIESLESRTEGWVVGLKMAALSIQGRSDAGKFIRDFSGSHRYILDYLVEEVLKRQPAHIQAFLLKTSILEKMSGPLCDALIGEKSERSGEGSLSTLEYLERNNLFLISLDDEQIWYRYHYLFTDLLRTRLQRSLSAAEIAQLHIRAADWHGHNGSALEAIHHASMAADEERVERFVEQNYMELVSRGEQSWLRYWTGKLNKELVYRRPWLCIYEAYSHSWFGELDEADLLLEMAEKRIRSETSNPDTHSMLGFLTYVKSRVTAMRGDLPQAIELCLAAREHVPAGNPALQLDTRITLGYEYFLNGDYANASLVLNETIRSGRAVGAVINTFAASCVLARLYANQGLLKKSHETYMIAAQSIPNASGQHLGVRSLVEMGIADVLYEWNDLDTALSHLKQGLALLSWWGKADDLILAHITLAWIQLAKANNDGAMEALQKALQIIQTSGVFPEARNALDLARVKLWLAQGNTQEASRWITSLRERFGSNKSLRPENELVHIAQARVLIAQKKLDEALGLLVRLEESTHAGNRQGRLIEVLTLKALALQTRGDARNANIALKKSLALAEPEGYMRIFLDEGEPMLKLLKSLRRSKLTPSLKEYVNRLLEASPLA
jgi:LuxR family maltose regulon positive regulatory protein